MLSEKYQALYQDLVASARGAKVTNAEVSLAQLLRDLGYENASSFYHMVSKLKDDGNIASLRSLNDTLKDIGINSKRIKDAIDGAPTNAIPRELRLLTAPAGNEVWIEDQPMKKLIVESEAAAGIVKQLAGVDPEAWIRVIRSAMCLLGMTAIIEIER